MCYHSQIPRPISTSLLLIASCDATCGTHTTKNWTLTLKQAVNRCKALAHTVLCILTLRPSLCYLPFELIQNLHFKGSLAWIMMSMLKPWCGSIIVRDRFIRGANRETWLKLLLTVSYQACLWGSGSQPGRNSSPGRNFMNSGGEFPLYSKCCTSFLRWHWSFQLFISLCIFRLFSGLSHVFVDKF